MKIHFQNVRIVDLLRTVLTPVWMSLALRRIPTSAPDPIVSDLKEKENMTEILLEILKLYGLKEIIGSKHNPQILAMFAEIGYDWVTDDETAWCSAALNYFCKKLGYERSGKLDARSWLKMPIVVINPQLGDIVILWRNSPTAWEGHVGLYISQDIHNIYVLGGNQGNMLSIAPYDKERILGFRQVRKLKDIKP